MSCVKVIGMRHLAFPEKGNFKNQPMSLDVQKSATIAFSSAKLCPERLTEMEDKFFINQWLKNSKGLDKKLGMET